MSAASASEDGVALSGPDTVRYSAQTTIGRGDPVRMLVSAQLWQLLVGPLAVVVTWPLLLLIALCAALGWTVALIVAGAALLVRLAWWLRAAMRSGRAVRQADSIGTFEQLDVLESGLVLRIGAARERLGYEHLRRVQRFGSVLVLTTGLRAAGGPRTMFWPARLLPRQWRVFVRARIRRRGPAPTP